MAYLPVSSPGEIAAPRVTQVCMRDLLETACRVETGGKFVSQGLVLHKSIYLRRPDRLFVQTLGVELARSDAGDLRADEGGAVVKIVTAILRPDFKLPVMRDECVEMLGALVRGSGIERRSVGKRA